jgi:hypothetical protein
MACNTQVVMDCPIDREDAREKRQQAPGWIPPKNLATPQKIPRIPPQTKTTTVPTLGRPFSGSDTT